MRQAEMMALISVALMVLLLSHTSQAAPARESDISGTRSNERYSDLLREWLWRTRGGSGALTRERKAQIDAGFLSRHSAVANLMRGLDAHREASNPYGPGRRK